MTICPCGARRVQGRRQRTPSPAAGFATLDSSSHTAADCALSALNNLEELGAACKRSAVAAARVRPGRHPPAGGGGRGGGEAGLLLEVGVGALLRLLDQIDQARVLALHAAANRPISLQSLRQQDHCR